MRALLLGCTVWLTACPQTPDPLDDDDSATPTPPSWCESLGLTEVAWREDGVSPPGRHDVVRGFEVPTMDGGTIRLQDVWTGCDAIVVVTDATTVQPGVDNAPAWASEDDLLGLLQGSPRNARYFFLSVRSDLDTAATLAELQGLLGAALGRLPAEDAAWWAQRAHVVAAHADDVGGWVDGITGAGILGAGIGRAGFGIDRWQRLRTIGNFADVGRYTPGAPEGVWPWRANVAYAAHEARWYNAEAARADAQAADGALIVRSWDGEVFGLEAETDVAFPDAAALAGYDTLQLDLTMDCPDAGGAERGSCGAWDYLVHAYLQVPGDPDPGWVELGRFISTYHREGRYVVDATAALPLLREGGTRHIKLTVSPPWNPQAYAMTLDFRFVDGGSGLVPVRAEPLFSGGSFNAAYNDVRDPLSIDIPATARRVELRAITTGHGGATNNCAEFCDHRHVFSVGEQSWTQQFDAVASNTGCIPQIERGMSPNQGGTWWLGRGGWCPGQQVDPFVVDVTSAVTPGQPATVTYEGNYRGGAIPDGSGDIVLSSWLVIWEDAGR